MKIAYIYIAFTTVCMALGCQRMDSPQEKPREIVLGLGNTFDADVTFTKTTDVTSIPSSLYWGGSTGSRGSESAKWSSSSATVSTNKIYTGKYQTYSPTSYNLYVSNVSMSIGSSCTISASNTIDVIAGAVTSSSTEPSITMGHIFARTGTLTMNTQSGYSISNISWTITGISAINGTAGTYNLSSGVWTATSASLSQTAISSSSDYYLIPGTYRIGCTYTLTKGDWTHQFTKTADVTLAGGKINNITGTASGGAASEIVITVSLSEWGSQTLTPTFS